MKILFVAPRYHTNQEPIVRTLLGRGHRVLFHVATVGPIENHELLNPVIVKESIVSVLWRRLRRDSGVNNRSYFPSPVAYLRELLKERPAVTIIRLHGRVYSYLAASCARLAGSQVVFYEQTPLELVPRFSLRPTQLARYIRHNAPLWFFGAAWMTPLGTPNQPPPARCHLIPFVAPSLKAPLPAHYPPRIIAVGKYQKRKNQLLLAQALMALADRYPFHVTFVGEVSSDEHRQNKRLLENFIAESPMRGRTTFMDNVPHAEMHSLYTQNDVFVLPASNEPGAISPLEALAAGLPAIVSDTCGTRCYVSEEAGRVFKSNDQRSLESALEVYLSAPHHLSAAKEGLNKADLRAS